MQRHDDRASTQKVSSNPNQFFDIHGVLLFAAQKNYNPLYMPLFQRREYSLILRKACLEQNVELVEMLLKYRGKLDIDVNARSTNGYTPLDWALDGDGSAETKMRLMSLLLAAGAETGNDLEDDHRDDVQANMSDTSDDEMPEWPLRCTIL